ncbi:MAG: TRAP transporter large permease subunit [Betaproteobacteria bacterium]|nr:MAG: TRAP transporter large permease subunit [Betaproteobacteria bacterium]TAG48286.1 MAG: TRAP transporter large permease subunit [Betaproteobacteria bacterium]
MKIKKELWFGLIIMAMIALPSIVFMPWSSMSLGHYGLLMLSLVVVAIMLGFPTAFTLMGMGVIFAFIAYYAQKGGNPTVAINHTLDLMVQRTYGVMTNEVLISIPLFVFMGYLVERANLIEKLFKSLHLALARVPGSLAVATLVTCAIFATATGIVGAVVTLMGLLALPAMMRAGYDIKLSAGAITAGGCLGILIPPSVMLIVYGATAGVSVVQLYAGAFFPGLMLAFLYILYVVVVAWWKPHLAPPLPMAERTVALSPTAAAVSASGTKLALPALLSSIGKDRALKLPSRSVLKQALVALLPAILAFALLAMIHKSVTTPDAVVDSGGLVEMGAASSGTGSSATVSGGLQEPAATDGLKEPPAAASEGVKEPPVDGLKEPPADGVKEPPGAAATTATVATPATDAPVAKADTAKPTSTAPAAQATLPTPTWFWIVLSVIVACLAGFYAILNWQRFEIYKLLLESFFPLAFMILAVLGSIVFGLATPTEAAAIGSIGGFVLAACYLAAAKPSAERAKILRTWIPFWLLIFASIVWFTLLKTEFITSSVPMWLGWISMAAFALWCALATVQVRLQNVLSESVFLTAKTSAMVCWLFVGSSIFSAAFALLGGQEVIEKWVLSLGLTTTQFLILSQFIIFILGWPLEWTEIIVIFMPIFIPLLAKFGVDPLFFGLLVALNLQTAFLSPPVAMAAFYLKGVAPPHVTLNQIFAGMMPFMAIQVVALVLLYTFPQIGMWLPNVLYK